MPVSERKVVIVGAGAVGSTCAFSLMRTGLADEIVLVDLDRRRAEGEVADMNHGLSFVPPVEIRAGDYTDCKKASIIVISAGAKQRPGQSRLDLVNQNVRICRSIVDRVVENSQDAIMIMVTNPVDVLTYFAIKRAGWPPGRIIGSGTVLDSARFRYLLSRLYQVDVRNVHAYVAGEHGDSEVALWSMTHIGGMSLEDYCKICGSRIPPVNRDDILNQVRESAYHVIESKGATNYAVSLALERIIGAILRDENSILTVSSMIDGVYGIRNVCLSLPSLVNRKGVDHVMYATLDQAEVDALHKSAEALREVIERVEAESYSDEKAKG